MDYILKHYGIFWGDFWWYTQDINKLFRTGEFRKEYGECELGSKCPKHQKRVKESLRKYDDVFLLYNVMKYPISGLQDAINRFLFEKECNNSLYSKKNVVTHS